MIYIRVRNLLLQKYAFELKNVGATFQRLTNIMFSEILEKMMEVYIDDILVKFADATDHIRHLEECFKVLQTIGMKLNLGKFTFGVSSGKILSFLMTQRGIEVSQERVRAFQNLP